MSSSSISSTLTRATLTGLANLIKLTPTGTIFAFLTLNPILTNNGQCSSTNKYLSTMLIALCSLSCTFSTFTDSYTDEEGNTRYGIVTPKGLWPASSRHHDMDLSYFKLRAVDFVHAVSSLLVFGVVSLLNKNVVECLYSELESTHEDLVKAVPVLGGVVACGVSALFPCTRHGIGYPSIETWTPSSSSLA